MAQLNQADVFVLTYEADVGDFLCTTCYKICTPNAEKYCCKKAGEKTMLERSADSEFLRACMHRMAIDQIAKAIADGKAVVDAEGCCFFCCSKTDRNGIECAKIPKRVLLARTIEQLHPLAMKHLENFLELRKKNKLIELEKAHQHVFKVWDKYVMEQVQLNPETTYPDHMYLKQQRIERKTIREETERLDTENIAMRKRFEKKMTVSRQACLQLVKKSIQKPKEKETDRHCRNRPPPMKMATEGIVMATKEFDLMKM